jgi:hypothetical protein
VVEAQGLPAVDLVVARLEPFDPSWVPNYPTFKDPAQGVNVGASLCRLGFPFHSITPEWDQATQMFRLPNGAVPVPFFASEGMVARMIEFVPGPGEPAPPFMQGWLETTSPGLRGQSGGPIFDEHGTVWAIQVNTAHYPLGFDPPTPGRSQDKVHQFLNVGRGVHPQTILGLLNKMKIQYSISPY